MLAQQNEFEYEFEFYKRSSNFRKKNEFNIPTKTFVSAKVDLTHWRRCKASVDAVKHLQAHTYLDHLINFHVFKRRIKCRHGDFWLLTFRNNTDIDTAAKYFTNSTGGLHFCMKFKCFQWYSQPVIQTVSLADCIIQYSSLLSHTQFPALTSLWISPHHAAHILYLASISWFCRRIPLCLSDYLKLSAVAL